MVMTKKGQQEHHSQRVVLLCFFNLLIVSRELKYAAMIVNFTITTFQSRQWFFYPIQKNGIQLK